MTPQSENTNRTPAYQIRVLDRAMDILDSFTLGQRELGIRELVEMTGLNRSTTIRLVANLERRGLLQQASTPGRFRLGQRLFEMGSIVYSSFSLREAAAGPLSRLERRSGSTILLAAPNGEYTVIVERRQGVGDGFAMVPMPGEVGQVRPLTYGPIGHVLMAMLPAEAVDDLLRKYPLEQYTPYSITDRDRFLKRLPTIRSEGYATDVNEVVEGLMGFAAPIFDFAGDPVGVLALGFPATREDDREFLDVAIRELKQAAAEASANMGYVENPAADDHLDAPGPGQD